MRLTRPDRLELVGRLLGLDPPPATGARVLEIGCGAGGNLLPMAEAFPDARFTGIDLDETRLAAGRELAAAAGLRNVALVRRDLREPHDDLGEIDYVIAHGVYSRVPAAVRAALLDLVAQRLTPRGIALVSHDTKPGALPRQLAREMMLRHARRFTAPDERVAQARAILTFLARAARTSEPTYRAVLGEQVAALSEQPDAAVARDVLVEIGDPFWLGEVAADCAARGLAFLADADLHEPALRPEVLAALPRFASGPVEREQARDCLTNRAFRMTLICRRDAAPADDARAVHADKLEHLYLSSRAVSHLAGVPEGSGPTRLPLAEPHEVDGPLLMRIGDAEARVTDPDVKLAVALLTRAWPRPLRFDALAGEIVARRGRAVQLDTLAVALLETVNAGIVEVGLRADPIVVEPGEQPRVTPLARLCAARGLPVVNLRHDVVELNADEVRLVALLDGTRGAEALAAQLGQPLQLITERLTVLGRKALLVA